MVTGTFLESHLNLILGMGVSDAFFALTSADPKIIAAWYESVTGLEFQIQMGSFNLAMKAAEGGLSLAVKSIFFGLEVFPKQPDHRFYRGRPC